MGPGMPRPRSSRSRPGSGAGGRRPTTPRPFPGQLAVRVAPKATRRVQAALQALGHVEPYEPARMLILHKGPKVADATVKSVVESLLRDGLVQDVTPVLRDPRSGVRLIPTDEITVRFRPEAPVQGTLTDMRRTEGVSVARRNEFSPSQYVLRVPQPSGKRTLDIARRLEARDDVEFAAPNYISDIKR